MPRSGFAYAMPLFIPFKMAFWSRFMGKCHLTGPQRVVFSAIRSWEVNLHASRIPQLQWGYRKATKSLEMSDEHIGVANGNCVMQCNVAQISSK